MAPVHIQSIAVAIQWLLSKKIKEVFLAVYPSILFARHITKASMLCDSQEIVCHKAGSLRVEAENFFSFELSTIYFLALYTG